MKAYPLFCLVALLCVYNINTGVAQTPDPSAPTDIASARQLLAEALTLFDSNANAKARVYAEPAYQFFLNDPDADPKDLAEAAYLMGLITIRLKQYKDFKPYFEESMEIWTILYPEGSLDIASKLHRISRCFYFAYMLDDALTVCTRAYQMRQKRLPPNDLDLAESLRVIGNIYLELGQYTTAIQYYESALPIEKINSGEESERVADVLGNLGHAWDLQGNFQKAIAVQEQALTIRQKILPPDHLDIALSCHTLGMAYKSLLKYEEALPYFEKALEIRVEKLGEADMDVANTCSEIGRTYLVRRDYRKALDYFEREQAIMSQLNETNPYLYADLGQANLGLKNYPEAVKWHEKSIAERREGSKNPNSPLASALVQLGNARLANNDFENALKDFNDAKQIWETVFGPQSQNAAAADAGLANAYQKRYLQTGQANLLQKARYYYRLAFKAIDESMREETYSEGQKKVLAESVSNFENAINAEVQYLKTQPNNQIALEKSWQLSESMHSYLLFASTQEANARHFAGIPDAELSRDSALRSNITALELKRRSLIERQGLNLSDSLVLTVSVQISAQKEEAQLLKAYFEKNHPNYFRLKYQLETSSIEKTQQLLSPQQTLLEYFTGDSSIFVFVVQHEGSRLVKLPRDFPLALWVQHLREGISGYHTATQKTTALYQKTVLQYADAAQKLYQKLFAPIAQFLTPELIVVPGDGFADLPFEALLSAAPKDLSNFNTYPFLLRSHTVQYAYSATMLHQMSTLQHPQNPTEGLLAFAPFFEEDPESLALDLRRSEGVRLGFTPLPFSGEEVFKAKKRYGGQSKVLTGKEASKEKFLELAAEYKILHLATHGKANHLAGDFSFLAFASKDENLENGLLSVGELYNLSINADLVLLSACETGIGEQQRGEGVVSLARAFAFAGAKSIVASLWSVNDKSTMQVMDNFYVGIKSGKPQNIALANAKLMYLEKNPGQSAHPFFWAAFVGIGDMGTFKN